MRLGAEVRQGYGLTEATFTTIDGPRDVRGPGTVGRPVWGVEVRIVDTAGVPLARGQAGEILVRGQNVMAGYLDDPETSARVVRDGWLHTGDIGVLDEDGRLSVVDRLKDLVLRGGNNVYPSEVEDALAHHPAIAGVAVIGRPDPYYGEEVVAIVVLQQGRTLPLEELDAFARERLAAHKVPREVVFLDRLPVGPSGKVLKRALRAQLFDGRLVATPVRPNVS